MRTIKRNIPEVNTSLSNYNKYFNQMEWRGIIENKNIFTVDQSSFSDAKNIFMDSKNRLVSRDPLQRDNTLPDNAMPENNSLIEVYQAGEHFVYVSKSPTNLYTVVVNGSTLSNLATYHLSIIKQYIICFNEQNARVYDINNPNLGWQNLTDLAEIPVTLRVSGNQSTTYPGNEFTSAYKEEYIWSENSQPDLPAGNAEVILNTPSKQYTWTIPNTYILTDYRILRPLNISLQENDLFTVAKDIICIGRSDYFLISYDGGNTFDRVWYPLHGKFLNIASISEDGEYFFFVAADAVFRCKLSDKSWIGGIFYYKSNASGEYGTLLNVTSENAMGYNNICHFLTSDIFTFLLYDIVEDVPTTYIFYKGPNLGELNLETFLNTMNMVEIENYIEFLEERTLTEKDCDNQRLKCELNSDMTIASVAGIFSYNTNSQFIFGIYPQLPNNHTTIFISENIPNSIYGALKNVSYQNLDSTHNTGGIKIDFNTFSETESIISRFSALISNPFTERMNAIVIKDSKLYCGGTLGRFAIYDITTGTFGSLISNPFTHTFNKLILDGNKIYCVGGVSEVSNRYGEFAIYDITTGTFGPLISNPFNDSITSAIIKDNKIYCGGTGGKFAIYDITTGTFGPLSTPFSSIVVFTSMVEYDNKIYCGINRNFVIYDIITGTFGPLINTPFTGSSGSISRTIINDTKIYCAGVSNNQFAIYDIITGTFGPLINTPFTGPSSSTINTMTIKDNKIYCISNEQFAFYDIDNEIFGTLISTPFVSNRMINAMITNNNDIYCVGGNTNDSNECQFAIYSEIEQAYGWSTYNLAITKDYYNLLTGGDIFFSLDNVDDGYPYSLSGGWISNLTVYNLSQTLLANLPDEITNRNTTWVVGDYFYIKVGNTIYTNSLIIKDAELNRIVISAQLIYTYIPEVNIFNKVPNVSYSDVELYLGFDNLLQITDNAVDGVNILFNLPAINNQTFISNITAMLNISTTEVAIFFLNNIVICAKVEDELFGFRYDYYNTKLSTGVRLGDNVINTLEGAFSIFPTRRGLAAMNYQAYMATTDQVLNYITNDIEELWTKFYDASSVIKIIQWRDILVFTNGTKTILLYDLVRTNWWKWEVPLNIQQMFTNQIDLKLISEELYIFKPHSRYKDFPTKYNQTNIDWYIQSQQLHMKLPNYYKNIKQLVFQLFDDTNKGLKNTIVAQIKVYRKRISIKEPEIVAFIIDELRTFVKRFNYWKINEIQWRLANDTETAIPAKLQLNGISVKYEVAEEVK